MYSVKPSPRVRADRFPTYSGPEWDKKISSSDHPNFWKYGVANLVFLDHVGAKKLVLDVGCGTGGSTLFLANKGETQWIVGVDLMKDMVKMAKTNAARRRLDNKVCFVVCDGRHLPFKPSLFDGLMSRGDAFCFLIPPRAAVQELRRTIKLGGVIVLEMDNRIDWKPGTTVSAGFLKRADGEIAYVIETFTKRRNHTTVSYILDSASRMAKGIARDAEFLEKGYKPSRRSLQEIRKVAVQIRRSVLTHWPSCRELIGLFKTAGFAEVQVIGDGLLMKLFLDGDRAIVEEMRENPQLFFDIEKRLVPYLNPAAAPTMILKAIAS